MIIRSICYAIALYRINLCLYTHSIVFHVGPSNIQTIAYNKSRLIIFNRSFYHSARALGKSLPPDQYVDFHIISSILLNYLLNYPGNMSLLEKVTNSPLSQFFQAYSLCSLWLSQDLCLQH